MPIARRAPTLRFRQSCTGESLVRGVAFVDGRISCWHNLQTQRIDDRCEGGLADTKCAPAQSAAAPINRTDRGSSETRYAHRCARIARGGRIRGRAPSQLCSPIAQLASIPKALAAVIRISGRSAGVVAPDSRRHRRYLLLAKYHRTSPPQAFLTPQPACCLGAADHPNKVRRGVGVWRTPDSLLGLSS